MRDLPPFNGRILNHYGYVEFCLIGAWALLLLGIVL
jgi:hypothetical protein